MAQELITARRLIIAAGLGVETLIGWLAYHYSWIVKWPPQGPVLHFIGWGTVAILFLSASIIFWLGTAVVASFWRYTTGKSNVTELNLK